jgi:Holliday junction resolvase RusA-like endonuclease
MIKINVTPLSVNNAWKGRRFKTEAYKVFEQEVYYLLPRLEVPDAKLKVHYRFGLSDKRSDGDNCIKQFQDILSKKYNFNDNKIYKWVVEKVDVPKGNEFIEFKFEVYDN